MTEDKPQSDKVIFGKELYLGMHPPEGEPGDDGIECVTLAWWLEVGDHSTASLRLVTKMGGASLETIHERLGALHDILRREPLEGLSIPDLMRAMRVYGKKYRPMVHQKGIRGIVRRISTEED